MNVGPARWALRSGAIALAVSFLASCGGHGASATNTLGGTVTGLSGTLVLQNNAGEELTLKADGAFAFSKASTAGLPDQVRVGQQPLWQTCTVSPGNGVAMIDARQVSVVCSATAARVSTLAGSGIARSNDGDARTASFNYPLGIVIRPDGGLFVTDSVAGLVRQVSIHGDVTTFAGGGFAGSLDDNGLKASFASLGGIALDNLGNLYLAEFFGNLIRRITPGADVTTFAGDGTPQSQNGKGRAASLNNPAGVAMGSQGEIYVIELDGQVVRKIMPDGEVSTLAGSGVPAFADGTGTAASFQNAFGIAIDKADNLYVADSGNHRIRKITPEGVVTTLAGSGQSGSADGVGAGASFNTPSGLTVDEDGNVYVVEIGNNLLRRVTPQGAVSTLAGQAGVAGSTDGVGSQARFFQPFGVAIAADGTLYIADTLSQKVRKVTPAR
ncbi:NHL repeat-containing protein [Hydrogenophaga sp. BPS33]|uniref:NHL repeat-containing protein n=1 Tax=Hydrogenophaga sp. BPS33 TaxID=2651974 RepID=UPI001359AA40|nr:NHL repeat-containing protein [Hydrogenophaga sp. BPS33]